MKLSKELERVKIPADKAAVAIERLRPLINSWPIEIRTEAVQQLALSAYTQGLLDCDQLHRSGRMKP